MHRSNRINGVIVDNKNTEKSVKKTEDHIEGIVVYLLRKYATKNELSSKLNADLKEEYDVIRSSN